MNWEIVLRKMQEIQSKEGAEQDPLSSLAIRAQARGLPVARVSYTVRRAVEYSEVAVSATVTIDCPQTEAYMDLAAEIVFTKALEYANDGFGSLVQGAQRIGESG